MKLGIFDSGIGGEAIASALQAEFPAAQLISINDKAHLPYGDRPVEEVRHLTDAAIQPLLVANCDLIVLACNTATAAAIDWLRSTYPDQLFIGIEPMVKPAALATKTKVIAVCATPATLASARYERLVKQYASTVTVIEPDCSKWAKLIEDNAINEADIKNTIDECLAQNADVIVLGCTHYHWIKDQIETLTQHKAIILEPSAAIGQRVRTLLGS